MDKLKIKPFSEKELGKKHNVKPMEVELKNWNLDARRKVNRLVQLAMNPNKETEIFDACCEILSITTTLEEDDIFKLSNDEIETIGLRIADEMNKKK